MLATVYIYTHHGCIATFWVNFVTGPRPPGLPTPLPSFPPCPRSPLPPFFPLFRTPWSRPHGPPKIAKRSSRVKRAKRASRARARGGGGGGVTAAAALRRRRRYGGGGVTASPRTTEDREAIFASEASEASFASCVDFFPSDGP